MALIAAPAAHATYLGDNGRIAYDRGGDIWAMDADGTNQEPLVSAASAPAWSPDGARLAFSCRFNTCTANADGTSVNTLDNFDVSPQDEPTWSPDGRRLAISSGDMCGSGCAYSNVWRIDAADGGDQIRMADYAVSPSWSPNGHIVYQYFYAFYTYPPAEIRSLDARYPGSYTQLTVADGGRSPDWSPDGTRIVFSRQGEITVMDQDGSNVRPLAVSGSEPAWSPDGAKIVFSRPAIDGHHDLWAMNADGTGEVRLTDTAGITESRPAWQPVPQPGYARPRAASPLRVSLVPAFERCLEPNRSHGPPLSFGACAPPDERGGFMTFGSRPPGTSPKAVGHVRLAVDSGDPDSVNRADVMISVSLTDVRRGFDHADGPGSLELVLPVRITDKHNGAFDSEQATVQDLDDYTDNPLRVLVPCAETADPTVGSTCAATTTVNALFPWQPNPVAERRRAIWQFDQIAVWDGGEDGFIESRDDNTVLAVQGVFVP
jgi:TolB protein